MSAAMDAVHDARRQVRIACLRVQAAELGLADVKSGWPSLAEAEEELDAAVMSAAAALEALRTERRQKGGLLL